MDENLELEEEEDTNFFLFLVVIGALATTFILICVGIGIVISIAILLLLFGLISSGILSISLFIGLQKKSFQKGFLSALILANVLVGANLGLITFFLYNRIAHYSAPQNAMILGAISGIISGYILGHLEFYLVGKATKYFKEKIKQS